MSITIKEDFILPSHGKIYTGNVDEMISLRSMTTADEMKRLAPSEFPYKVVAELIDDCMIKDPGISAYDMVIGDYEFLLHKLRIVTYGPDYKMDSICPYCGTHNIIPVDLSTLEFYEYTEDLNRYLKFVLPVTKKEIELNIQTPRMLDEVQQRNKKIQEKSNDKSYDPSLLTLLESLVKTVDGRVLDPGKLTIFLQSLPMADTNMIIKSSEKFVQGVGLNTRVQHTCSKCHLKYNTSFRITDEFFRPSI